MAYTDGNIIIGTSVDVGGIGTGLSKISKTLGKFTRSLTALTVGGGTAFAMLGKASIEAASDLQEVQNIVDVAFGDMSYKIEAFASTSIENFGMSELAAKQTAGSYMAMGKAMGLTSEDASDMAVSLTSLTGDMASFFNISQDYARVALSAVYTGETETLKRYGIVLTEANLQAYALTKGITTSVKAMNAHDKAILRYQYILQAVGEEGMGLMGDFNSTAMNWANQLRVVKEQFNLLTIAIGNGLIVALTPLLGILNDIIAALIKFVKIMWIILGNIFGIDFGAVAKGYEGAAEGMEDEAEAAEDLADGITKAGKAAKKYTSHLDELNILQESSSGSGSGAADTGLDLDIDLGDILDLNEAMEELKSNISTLYGMGVWLGEQLTSVLEGIDWDSIYEGARQFGSGLANFLNGLISTDLFKDVGHTIAGALNTAINSAWAFGKVFDFKQFGTKLAEGINEFFDTFDFNKLGQTIGVWWQGIKDAISSFAETIEWGDILKGIKEFFEGLTDEDAYDLIGLAAFALVVAGAIALLKTPIGEAFSKALIEGIEEALLGTSSTELSGLIGKWLGGVVGDFLIQLPSYIAIAFKLLWVTIKGFFTVTLPGLLAKIPISAIGQAIATFFTNAWNTVVEILSVAFSSGILSTIGAVLLIIAGTVLAIVNFIGMLTDGFSWLKEILMVIGIIIAGIGAIMLGASAWPVVIIGAIAAIVANIIIFWDEIVTFFKNLMQKEIDIATNIILGLYNAIKKAGDAILTFLNPAIEKIAPVIQFVGKIFEGVWIVIKAIIISGVQIFIQQLSLGYEFVKSALQLVQTIFTATVEFIRLGIKGVFTFTSNVITLIQKIISALINFIRTLFQAAFNWFLDNILNPVLSAITKIIDIVRDYVNTKLGEIQDLIEACKKFIFEAADKVWNKIEPTISKIYNFFKKKYDDIAEKIKNFVDTYITPAVNGAIGKFEKLRDDLKNIFGDIKSAAWELGNSMIDIAEKIINGIVNAVNDWLGGFNNFVSVAAKITGDDWSGVSMLSPVKLTRIPKLANGAVLPPNNPFMAILGDQRNGTNVEAPLSTIQDAVALVLEPYLKQLIDNTQELVNKDYATYIGDREIAKANNRGQRLLGASVIS